MEEETQIVLDRLAARFKASAKVSNLSIAEQQQVEIARALHRKSRVLVMDEPTAALSSRETDMLFALIRNCAVKAWRSSISAIGMAEIYELSDRVSVLRDGQYIGSLMRSELSARLVRMMVGRPLNDLFNKDRTIPKGDLVLE